jgi:hypothetical protein
LALSSSSSHGFTEDPAVSLKIPEMLRDATSLALAAELILEAIQLKLSNLLIISLDEIDCSRPLSFYGLDFLVAVVSIVFPMRQKHLNLTGINRK